MTECKTKRFEFHALSNREVIAHFDGGDISSDAGGLLLREVEQRTGILKQLAECFTDYRKRSGLSTRFRICWRKRCMECVWDMRSERSRPLASGSGACGHGG
jgi:hypothetical protein